MRIRTDRVKDGKGVKNSNMATQANAMQMMFEKANDSLSVILIFVAIIFISSLSVRLFVRYMFLTHKMSRRGFGSIENIAAGFAALLMVVMMWFVLGSMQ